MIDKFCDELQIEEKRIKVDIEDLFQYFCKGNFKATQEREYSENKVRVYTVFITPTLKVVFPASPHESNQGLRKFVKNASSFLRVSFTDEYHL